MKKYAAILLTFMLAGCGTPQALKPMAWLYTQMPENAPEKYQLGWRQGCESGMASMTNDYYRTFYHFQFEPELASDEMYYKAWQDTYNFCRHYVYGFLRQANMRTPLPNTPINKQIGGGTSLLDIFDYSTVTGSPGLIPWGDPNGTFGIIDGKPKTNILPDDNLFNYGKDPLFK